MKFNPPKLDNRSAFSGWLCVQHNYVNKKLGKPLFDCTNVNDYWRYGSDEKCRVSDEKTN